MPRAMYPCRQGRTPNAVPRSRLGSLWLVLAAGAAMSGCDARQGNAQAPAEAQRWGATQGGGVSGDPARGERIALEKCGACHGADGNGGPDSHVPKLAGQNLSYLYWQLRAFRENVRKSEIMAPTAATLAYAEIADVAAYFSLQARKADPAANDSLTARGALLFTSRMPSCAMCHGSAPGQAGPMAGMMQGGMTRGAMMGGMMGPGAANIPNLEGQHADYIVDQLNRFAAGEREGGIMNSVAAGLGDGDRRTIAEFLSGNTS